MDSRVTSIAGGVAITAVVAGFGVVGVLVCSRYLSSIRREYDHLCYTVGLLRSELNTLRSELAELKSQQYSDLRTPVKVRHQPRLLVEVGGGDNPSTSFNEYGHRRVTSYQSLTSDAEYTDAEDEWQNETGEFSQPRMYDVHLPPLSFADVDKMFNSENVRLGYDMLKKRFDGGDRSTELLWRLARCCHELACRTSDKSKKKELIFEGKIFALESHCANQDDFNSLKWAAIMTGQSTDYLGTKEKIEEGGKFKELLDKALLMDHKEFSLRHMRGRYAYSVASLSWIERKAAAVFYATPPTATLDEALEDFLSAYEEKPEWIENLMFIARIYLAKGDKQNAKTFLNKVLSLTPSDEAEREMLREATKLLMKC